MKIIMPILLFSLFSPKSNKLPILIPPIFFIIWFSTFPFSFNTTIWNTFFFSDNLSFSLSSLTFFSMILIFLSSQNIKKTLILLSSICSLLILSFLSAHTISFYIFFEATLIPTILLITINGKTPERIQAGIYLLMYTILGSLPLLIGIIYFSSHSSFNLIFSSPLLFSSPIMFMLAFLIKLPMFFFHLWLPKAHVEAPLEGSMILAAVLLKLGGYGLIRLSPPSILIHHKINSSLISISLIGSFFTSMMCLRQKDIKALIAYSSVAHMGLVISAIMTSKNIGFSSATFMMMAHGLSSSALFVLATILYNHSHSRNMLTFKGLLSIFPNLTFWWFMFSALNISAPPSLNMISETLIFSSLCQFDLSNSPIILFSSLATASFSIFLYSNISHNSPNPSYPHNQTNQKNFLSLFTHFLPLILISLKSELFFFQYYLKSFLTLTCGVKNPSMIILFPMAFSSILFFIISAILFYFNLLIYFNFPILIISSMEMNIALILDWMSSLFTSCVSLISTAILIFSFSYISQKYHKRFFLILFCFVMSMIILIFSNNIFFIMLGWDGLGLSSYILVIFYQNHKSSESGALTILSNRLGDTCIILAIGTLTSIGSWEIQMSSSYPLLPILFLLTATLTKSAQFPFMAWLPAAMAAPTPISALVHSSTLVTAGVYLMIRVNEYFHPLMSSIILISSLFTLLFSGMSANWEQDMKKIIAMSTLSQISLMMFAIAINSLITAYFHLIIHALFKSTMFLCAGAMIHGSNYQDMRSMGASTNKSPSLMTSLGICNLALMGMPFLSGYFSKDSIIETSLSHPQNISILILILISIGLTSSYSSRMMMISSLFITKMQKDKTFHLDLYMFIPILSMTPLSIFMGSLLMWTILPTQFSIIPLFMKKSIFIFIIMGMLTGFTLSYKSNNFNSMGESSISLWFSHFLSCIPLIHSLKLGQLLLKQDKTWMENLSTQGSYLTMKKLSSNPDKITYLKLMVLSSFLISPFIFLSIFLLSLSSALYWS